MSVKKRRNPLKVWLEKNDVTRDDLAHRAGTSTAFMIDLVNEKHGRPGIDVVDNIHLVTKIPIASLNVWLRFVREKNGQTREAV